MKTNKYLEMKALYQKQKEFLEMLEEFKIHAIDGMDQLDEEFVELSNNDFMELCMEFYMRRMDEKTEEGGS
jgi:hypothetical protein